MEQRAIEQQAANHQLEALRYAMGAQRRRDHLGYASWLDSGTSTSTTSITSGTYWSNLYGYKTYEAKEKAKARKQTRIDVRETRVPWPHAVKKPNLLTELQKEFDAWAGNAKAELYG